MKNFPIRRHPTFPPGFVFGPLLEQAFETHENQYEKISHHLQRVSSGFCLFYDRCAVLFAENAGRDNG